MFIDGFGISGYRSFGQTLQMVGPLDKINLFIGQNNAGKSNLLLFLVHHYGIALKLAKGDSAKQLQLAHLDSHQGMNSPKLRVSFGIKIGGEQFQNGLKRFESNLQRHGLDAKPLEKILCSKYLTQGTGCAWFCYVREGNEFKLIPDLLKEIRTEGILEDHKWSQLWSVLTGQNGGSLERHWIPEILRMLSSLIPDPPKIELVPAIRKVGEAGTAAQDFSGVGLIDRLAELQHPSCCAPLRFGQV